jgi:arginase
LAARDLGDVTPPPYRDFVRPVLRPRNEEGVAAYSGGLARLVASAAADGAFVLVLGGDCSIVLGCLLGARQACGPGIGLAYVDAHADFGTPEESRTGSAASMCLALAVGRGDTPLARLTDGEPLVRPEEVVLIGRRDQAEPWYGHDALHRMAILDLPSRTVRKDGAAKVADAALTRLDTRRFWIHLDADVIDPSLVPAVDSPIPDGLKLTELADLLVPLACHPNAVGMELTIYDPTLDPLRSSAVQLALLLEKVLRGP